MNDINIYIESLINMPDGGVCVELARLGNQMGSEAQSPGMEYGAEGGRGQRECESVAG